MTPLKKDQQREDDRYVCGCGGNPHPHTYLSLLLEGSFSVHSWIERIKRRCAQKAAWGGPLLVLALAVVELGDWSSLKKMHTTYIWMYSNHRRPF
jgi:hypothetical protein